jgi:hypothetical protein
MSKIRITKAPWIAAVSARGQTIEVGVEVICTKASVATEVVKSAGCTFFFYFRSAQDSPALDWSEPTNGNVAISYWAEALLPEQLLLKWQNATGHWLNYFLDVALYGYITKSLKTIPAKESGSEGEVNAVVLQQYV